MDVLKGIFGDSNPFNGLKSEHKPIPLQRKRDIEYEVERQTSKLEGEGHLILSVTTNKYNERVIVYRMYYNDVQDDININLRVRVITDKGVEIPDPNIYLNIFPKDQHMQIADFKIEGNHVNRGYGSLVMGEILELAHQMRIKFITGWISHVDWDHIDRSAHFYRKFGFEVDLKDGHGNILWLNKELGATRDEYDEHLLYYDLKITDLT